jgi:hypothetical protein
MWSCLDVPNLGRSAPAMSLAQACANVPQQFSGGVAVVPAGTSFVLFG